ncbi:hypothetical protein K7B10_00260 [Streptomyces flavotricini]|uniref:Secreted protein n=1 Tax=Streptomyces flavotricini TaxID=66888 RepID=A0ABS8DXC0_9ACTN|nr:hypothetical protein [Streptomyces flavotricini]MCC0093263.1 hypothetical protein [Streptomyces flavotricini]
MGWLSSWWSGLYVSMKVGILGIVGVIIGGVFSLWSGVFSGKSDRHADKPAPSASASAPHPSPSSIGLPAPRPEQGRPACGDKPGHDVTIEPKQLTVASDGSLTAEVNCNLQEGWCLTWMVQLDGVGKPVPHTNYYPKDDLGRPGPYTFDVHLSPSEPGSARTIYVVLMDNFAHRQLSETATRTDRS